MLLTHDFPDPTAHSPQRIVTTTTLQGLHALNGPLMLDRAAALSQRLLRDVPDGDGNATSDESRIRLAYRLLFSREPSERERDIGLAFLGESSGDVHATTWVQYAHVLLASNEFLFVD